MLLKLLVPHMVLWGLSLVLKNTSTHIKLFSNVLGYIINVLCFRTVLQPYLKSHFYMSIQPAFQAYLKKHHTYISISGPQFGNWYIRFKFFVQFWSLSSRKAQGFAMYQSAYFQWRSRLPKCLFSWWKDAQAHIIVSFSHAMLGL